MSVSTIQIKNKSLLDKIRILKMAMKYKSHEDVISQLIKNQVVNRKPPLLKEKLFKKRK